MRLSEAANVKAQDFNWDEGTVIILGKVALITGVGSQIGFGRGITLTLVREGCDIIVNDVDIERAKK
jgi:S-adenosylhomocysteine hydrolase